MTNTNSNIMKKTIIPLALLAVLSLATTGCQKEQTVTPSSGRTEQVTEKYNYRYTINDRAYYVNVTTEAEKQQLFEFLMEEARRGNTVSIRRLDTTSQSALTKETVTFVTTNKNEALAWLKNMAEQDYTVSMTYDENTGEFTCTAIR